MKRLVAFCFVLIITASGAALAAAAAEAPGPAVIRVDAADGVMKVNPMVYGQFIEHLGNCIKDGIWTPHHDKGRIALGGIREDLFALLSELKMPILRWPGGCFSDGYHWEDGIGPVESRPARRNLAWA